MVVTFVQEISEVTEAKLLPRIRQKSRLDVIFRAKGSPASPPTSDSHQHQTVCILELPFRRFGRLCQSKRIGDWVVRVLEWCWGIFGVITHHTGDT